MRRKGCPRINARRVALEAQTIGRVERRARRALTNAEAMLLALVATGKTVIGLKGEELSDTKNVDALVAAKGAG